MNLRHEIFAEQIAVKIQYNSCRTIRTDVINTYYNNDPEIIRRIMVIFFFFFLARYVVNCLFSPIVALTFWR